MWTEQFLYINSIPIYNTVVLKDKLVQNTKARVGAHITLPFFVKNACEAYG